MRKATEHDTPATQTDRAAHFLERLSSCAQALTPQAAHESRTTCARGGHEVDLHRSRGKCLVRRPLIAGFQMPTEVAMPLISVIVVLVVVGVVLYLIENYIPMSPPIRTVLRVVVVLALVVWLLQTFGIVGPTIRVR
jgi:hypothetical protein